MASGKIIDPTNTANEALFDALVRHQIYLLRVSGSIRNRIQDILNKTEQDIAEKIRDRLRNNVGLTSPLALRKMETLLRIIRNIRTEAWDQIDKAWAEELVAIAKVEPELLDQMIKTVSPVILETTLPTARQLTAIVTARPFEGRTMRQWARKLRADDIARMDGVIRAGMVAGETSAQIARRVVGTANLRGRDGVFQITRDHANSVTRTFVNFVANEARTEWANLNNDIADDEQFVATLDARTTAQCRSLDGKVYPIGVGPRPPLHYNCRSLRVLFLLGDNISTRPFKASTEQQLLREFSAQRGFKKPGTRDGLPRGTKGDFDAFSRKRVRELTGIMPASTSYQKWLEAQSAQFQDDVLGKTKGRLFRQGGLTLDKYVNRSGDELTLSQLASRHADAFRAAGLNPESY